jgi:hypothetical protein
MVNGWLPGGGRPAPASGQPAVPRDRAPRISSMSASQAGSHTVLRS